MAINREKQAVIKDLPMLEFYNKINRINEKKTKDPSGDTKLVTYITFGTEVIFTQCWFNKGVCTMIMFDLEEVYNAYGGQKGGLQDVVEDFCSRYTYFEDRGNSVIALSTEELMDDGKYASKLFTALYVFVKNLNEYFGNHEENIYTEDDARTFYRQYCEAQKKKHKGISITSLIMFGVSILGTMIGMTLLAIITIPTFVGAIYHYVRVKYFGNEYFRVRER